ncbi:MAG: CbiX/SirB N-terminal domain-containing protein [Sulfurisoma sp.]|nr:CbiX/SirB N-terminal domain-containing protein [Sulfurisoma sp.]
MKGIILFGHGARNPDWAQPFHRIRASMERQQPGALIELGFLELMRPTLDEAIDSLAARGVTEISIVPIFMAAGSHVRKDLPLLVGAALDRHPNLAVDIVAPVGEADYVIDAMAKYALD